MASSPTARPRNQSAYWVSLTFASLAVVFALCPLPFRSPVADTVHVPASVTDPTPIRKAPSHATYTLGEFTYQCNECHRNAAGPSVAGKDFTKHTEIVLAHGINTRCLNCHHPLNRETYVDDFGEEIPWDQPQLLCAKCHGPVYRDWQHGSHGRINGYWDVSQGEQVRLKCIECHDPHHPPFPPLDSAAGPSTLRAPPHRGEPHAGEHNPLRVTEDAPPSGNVDSPHRDASHE